MKGENIQKKYFYEEHIGRRYLCQIEKKSDNRARFSLRKKEQKKKKV